MARLETARGNDPPLAGSFRDPAGAVLATRERVLRVVNRAGMGDLQAFLSAPAGIRWMCSGAVAPTSIVDGEERQALLEDPALASLYAAVKGEAILEHERIPFPSFPYEWPPEMLHAAAGLTLDLALDLLPEGFGLKDATPYNVLFRGPVPVFIDLLSIERRAAGDALWLPYAQFVRTFLLPLLASRHFGLRLDYTLLARRDGLEPEEVYGWLRGTQKLRRPFFSLVSLPTWLGKRRGRDGSSLYHREPLTDAAQARYIVESLLKRLRRTLDRVAPGGVGSSRWTGYMEGDHNYTAGQFTAKEQFVQRALAAHTPRAVLDVGCNTGHFSLMAARAGARVVAIDYDPTVAGAVWRKARAEKLDVLPLVVDLTRPTPGVGWENREWPSFLDRARGAFDAVFMLAVVHHLLVTERVPLARIVDLAAELTSDVLVIEFVAPEDSQFRSLTRGREELHRGLNAAVFENAFRRRFEILEAQPLEGAARRLYRMRQSPRS